MLAIARQQDDGTRTFGQCGNPVDQKYRSKHLQKEQGLIGASKFYVLAISNSEDQKGIAFPFLPRMFAFLPRTHHVALLRIIFHAFSCF